MKPYSFLDAPGNHHLKVMLKEGQSGITFSTFISVLDAVQGSLI